MKTNTTNERNKLWGTLEALRASWGNDAKLCDLRDAEFSAGGWVDLAVKAAGWTESGRAVVGANSWWSLTTEQFAAEVLAAFDAGPIQKLDQLIEALIAADQITNDGERDEVDRQTWTRLNDLRELITTGQVA